MRELPVTEPPSVHGNCVGCGSEPRNGERRGSRGGRKRRRQHMRPLYARGVVPPGSRATSLRKGSRRKHPAADRSVFAQPRSAPRRPHRQASVSDIDQHPQACQLVVAHRDHRHPTPPRQALHRLSSVTSLSVRPVTFLSVIYKDVSHNSEFWKIIWHRWFSLMLPQCPGLAFTLSRVC